MQREIVSAAARFNVLDCGRRFGKDVLCIDLTIKTALEGAPAAWFAPTYKQMVEVWRTFADTLAPVTKRRSEQEHRLELVTGGVIDMWSLDSPDTARGRAYKRVVVNEAAQVANLLDAWEMVIRPTLADYRGDAWFPSTPRGLNGYWTLYQRGQDAEQSEWRSWRFPTASNPFIHADEIEAARRELPERVFAQEYLAEFIEDGAGVFRGVRACVTAVRQEQAAAGHAYVIGCDWGKLDDFTVLTVLDLTDRAVVAVDRFNQIDYHVQTQRLETLCQRFHPSLVIAERNSIGEPILEQLGRMGLPVWGWTASNATKGKVIEELGLAFERQLIKIPDEATLIAELTAYSADRLPSGLIRYSAPEGMHDDCVMSLALAWQGVGMVRTGPSKTSYAMQGQRPQPVERIPGRPAPTGWRIGNG